MSRLTQLPYVIDALITMFRAAVPSDVTVLDGPDVASRDLLEFVVVGDSGEDTEPSTFGQDWAGLGAQSKDEQGSVECVVVAQAGDVDLRTRRLRAFELFALCEVAQRANLNLGGIVLFSAITSGTYRPLSTSQGTGAEVGFTVTYKARI